MAKRAKGGLLAELERAAKATSSACLILTGYVGRPNAVINGRGMLASRAVWILAHGDPGDRHVLHTCHRGQEGCINIRHLYLGDNDQNIRDMVAAGRSTRGERSAQHKLTRRQVQEIRRLMAAGVPQRAIAREFGVSRATCSSIKHGRVWGWLAPEPALCRA
jgi:hypothetical protein